MFFTCCISFNSFSSVPLQYARAYAPPFLFSNSSNCNRRFVRHRICVGGYSLRLPLRGCASSVCGELFLLSRALRVPTYVGVEEAVNLTQSSRSAKSTSTSCSMLEPCAHERRSAFVVCFPLLRICSFAAS